jgi:hypothetical protein
MNQAPKRRGRPPKVTLCDVNSAIIRNMVDSVCASDKQVGGTHYRTKSIQPWDAMESWMSREEFVGFLRGNALKYLARCNDKGGVEDVKKAQHYIEKLLEVLGDA